MPLQSRSTPGRSTGSATRAFQSLVAARSPLQQRMVSAAVTCSAAQAAVRVARPTQRQSVVNAAPQQRRRAPAARRNSLTVAATAAPAAPVSPFSMVQSEEQLFALIKAGAGNGSVRPVSVSRVYRHANRCAGPCRPLLAPRMALHAVCVPGQAAQLFVPRPCARQVPDRVVAAFHELYGNYKAAILAGASPGADEGFVARVMASVRRRTGAPDPWRPPSHAQHVCKTTWSGVHV